MKVQKADLGVLLNHSQLRAALRGRYGFEYLPFYADAAKKAGVSVVFFSPRSFLRKNKLIFAYRWNPENRTYQDGLYEIPSVIHNRALLLKKGGKRIYSFIVTDRTILYNRIMRFDKWKVHKRLSKDPRASKYLPNTAPLISDRQIENWLNRHETIYIKPRSGSLGLGVIRLCQSDQGIKVSRTVKGRSRHYRVSPHRLADIRKKIGRRPYLIQEGISLIRISNHPIDFRVSVQKGATGDWTISGIVAKVGTLQAHATNLAVGGKAVAVRKVLKTVFNESKAELVYRDLKEASLLIARQIEGIGPHIADLGLDLTVTRDGTIKFIEANGRDLRITFRNAKQRKMWRNTFQNPILYGAHLLQKKGE